MDASKTALKAAAPAVFFGSALRFALAPLSASADKAAHVTNAGVKDAVTIASEALKEAAKDVGSGFLAPVAFATLGYVLVAFRKKQ